MNLTIRVLATLLGTGAAAVAIAAAPVAGAASTTSTHQSGPATTTQRPGHVAIHVQPQQVSPPRVWGQFSSPAFLFDD